MALLFAAAALLELVPAGAIPPAVLAARDELLFVLIVEGGFLLAQATLVDIAARLRKRPPLWAVALIVVAVMLFSHYTWDVLQLAWQRGSLVFVPLLISVTERGTVLWRLPGRPELDRIAARALIANRIATGLGLLALLTLAMVLGIVFPGFYDFATLGGRLTMLAGAIYFAVAAFDDWRVRGPRFAKRPRVLFGYDAIGIRYLEPV